MTAVLCGGARPTRGALVLEGVLDVLAGLLDVRAGLVGLALGFEALVAGHLSDGVLDLALGLLDGVLGLVGEAHESAFLFVGEHGALASAADRTRCLLSPRAAPRDLTANWHRVRDARCAPPTPPGSPSPAPAGRRFLAACSSGSSSAREATCRAAVPSSSPPRWRHRVGRGEEEVDLAALVELGVQGLLIEQLRGLGLDEHLHLAVIDEGI